MAKSENPLDHLLRLDMWDYDGIRRAPDFLGQVNVDLTNLYNTNADVKATEQTWYAACHLVHYPDACRRHMISRMCAPVHAGGRNSTQQCKDFAAGALPADTGA